MRYIGGISLNGVMEEDLYAQRFQAALEAFCRENNCDLFGAAQLLRAFNYDYYKEVKDNVLSDLDIDYDIKISSVG